MGPGHYRHDPGGTEPVGGLPSRRHWHRRALHGGIAPGPGRMAGGGRRAVRQRSHRLRGPVWHRLPGGRGGRL